MKQHQAMLIGLVLALAPAPALAQKTSYDYDKTANFAAYRTFALKEGTNVGDPLIDNRLVGALEAELAAKGLTKDDANPDVFVVYHATFDKQKSLEGYTTGYGGYGWRWGGGMSSTNVRVNEIVVGTLVVDIADAAKKELVWRGIATKELDPGAKPEKRDQNIRKAVQKVLKEFPPKVKS